MTALGVRVVLMSESTTLGRDIMCSPDLVSVRRTTSEDEPISGGRPGKKHNANYLPTSDREEGISKIEIMAIDHSIDRCSSVSAMA